MGVSYIFSFKTKSCESTWCNDISEDKLKLGHTSFEAFLWNFPFFKLQRHKSCGSFLVLFLKSCFTILQAASSKLKGCKCCPLSKLN